MSTVKGLKLLRNLSFGIGKIYHKGDYIVDIPEDLLAEFQNGSPYIAEIAQVPSIKSSASAKDLSKLETVEKPVEPPKKPAPTKPTAKSTRTSKRSIKK